MSPIYLTNSEAQSGFLGIALTSRARIKKHTRQLYSRSMKLDRLVDDIRRAEDQLEQDGVHAADLYDGWGFQDVFVDRTRGESRHVGPSSVSDLASAGLVFVGRL